MGVEISRLLYLVGFFSPAFAGLLAYETLRMFMLDVRAISGYYNQIRLARSMGSGDDMFRTWSGPEGSSHKEPLPGTRSHRAHGAFFCVDSLSVSIAILH